MLLLWFKCYFGVVGLFGIGDFLYSLLIFVVIILFMLVMGVVCVV